MLLPIQIEHYKPTEQFARAVFCRNKYEVDYSIVPDKDFTSYRPSRCWMGERNSFARLAMKIASTKLENIGI